MTYEFQYNDAVRKAVPLFIGIMGPSGGGKTWSSLRLALGIQRVVGGDVALVDTESRGGRALKCADFFAFKHVPFEPPYPSLKYLAAVEHCVKMGAKTVIVDSMTHEHAGVGGYLEFAESELDRMAGDNYGKRQACKLASFIKPAAERRRMIDGLLNLGVNLICTFRAKEKVKPVKGENNKTEIVSYGFMPIAAEELVFEMDACCLLMPHANGVPTWQSEEIGERMMIKSARQFEEIFAKSEPLCEEIGERMARWAQGGKPAVADDRQALLDVGISKAKESRASLEGWWAALTKDQRVLLKGDLQALKDAAA